MEWALQLIISAEVALFQKQKQQSKCLRYMNTYACDEAKLILMWANAALQATSCV